MKTPTFAVLTAVACLAMSTACQGEERPTDLTPLPTVAAPPYLCKYIPQNAVKLMTGVRNPVVRGQFNVTNADDLGPLGMGICVIRQSEGDQPNALIIDLSPTPYPELVLEEFAVGATPLPEIMPGGRGYYYANPHDKNHAAQAILVHGKTELRVELEIGVKGRNNAADVVALMKLIAPKLITDTSAPTPSPSATPSATKRN